MRLDPYRSVPQEVKTAVFVTRGPIEGSMYAAYYPEDFSSSEFDDPLLTGTVASGGGGDGWMRFYFESDNEIAPSTYLSFAVSEADGTPVFSFSMSDDAVETDSYFDSGTNKWGLDVKWDAVPEAYYSIHSGQPLTLSVTLS